MKVSIIVPVYNVLSYLPKCLESLIHQSIQEKEIIIVDDGSTDGSSQLVDEYAKKEPCIKVIHKENGGLMSAWTTGVKVAQGEYIGFIDSDDFASLDMYESLYYKAVENDVDIVISNYIINGKIKGTHPLKDGKYVGNELRKEIQEHVFPSPHTYSISMSRMPKLFRRNIIIDNLKYTECLSRTFEDRYIVPAAILSAKSIYYTSEAYYYWMLRKGSNHGKYKKNLLDDIKRVYNIQYHIIVDKQFNLLQQWEEAYFDFVRLYVDRNIIRVNGFTTKYHSAKELLKDSIFLKRVKKYGFQGRDKLSAILKLAFILHAPSLLVLASYFSKRESDF